MFRAPILRVRRSLIATIIGVSACALLASADAQQIVNPPEIAPPIAAYSHLAIVPAGSDLLMIAGQIGNTAKGDLVADAEGQYEQALRNIVAILRSQGAGPENLVKVTTYLVKPLAADRVRAIRLAVLGNIKPPGTLVYVAGLARPNILVEIDATAVRPAVQQKQ